MNILSELLNPRYATFMLYAGGIGIQKGLEDGFCKKYIKLYKNQRTKNLGEDHIK